MRVQCTSVIFLLTLVWSSTLEAQIFQMPVGAAFGINSFEDDSGNLRDTHVWFHDNPYGSVFGCELTGVGRNSPEYCGYHAGEDWNLPGAQDRDCGQLIESPQDGEVVALPVSSGSHAVVVRYDLLGEAPIYMTFHHCAEHSRRRKGLINQGEKICEVGKTGAASCHLHWELNRYDRGEIEAMNAIVPNPWLEGIRCPDADFDWVTGNCNRPRKPRQPLELRKVLAKYGFPSLFLDDRGNESQMVTLTEGDRWEERTLVPNESFASPASLAFVEYEDGGEVVQMALKEVFEATLPNLEIEYRNEVGRWVKWDFKELTSFFAGGTEYRIRLLDDGDQATNNWKLVVPIPGHGQEETRARMEMIQWLNMRACGENEASCFERFEPRAFGPVFASFLPTPTPWNRWSGWVVSRDGAGNRRIGLLHYASSTENPLIRCILEIDPDTGDPGDRWTQIAPGKVYAIPDVPLDLLGADDIETDACNELR